MAEHSFKSIVYKVIAVILFAYLFPYALSSLFAVNTSAWQIYDPQTQAMVPNTMAQMLWNLIGWVILIFGGLMIFMSER